METFIALYLIVAFVLFTVAVVTSDPKEISYFQAAVAHIFWPVSVLAVSLHALFVGRRAQA
jgi:hypothetical protein